MCAHGLNLGSIWIQKSISSDFKIMRSTVGPIRSKNQALKRFCEIAEKDAHGLNPKSRQDMTLTDSQVEL